MSVFGVRFPRANGGGGGGGGSVALDDLTNVNAPTPADQDVLTYDSGASEWIPQAPTGGGGSSSSHLGEFDSTQFSALSWVNQDGASAVLQRGFVVMTEADNNAEVHALTKAIASPSGDWTVQTRISLGNLSSNEKGGGLVIREAGTGKLVIITAYLTSGSPAQGVYAFRWTSASAFDSALGSAINLASIQRLYGPLILQVRKVSSTLFYEVGLGDGEVFLQIHSEAATASFTTGPDEFGLFMFSAGSGTTKGAFKYLEQY